MTDLTLGLVLVGAFAVAGVLLYNRLQERSVRKHAERAFASPHADVLMAEERREPTLAAAPAPPSGASPDPRADYVMELAVADAVALGEGWQPIAQRFGSRVLLCEKAPGRWQAALQIVSRAGVVAESELVSFRAALETLAAGLGGSAAGPQLRATLEAARELDRACAEADIQVALHVVGVAPNHRFQGQPFQAAPRDDGVTLTLDVARTTEPVRAYEAMARAGQALAGQHGGRLVDDEGRALDERALASIAAQVRAVAQLLAVRGIEPGGALALRLFS